MKPAKTGLVFQNFTLHLLIMNGSSKQCADVSTKDGVIRLPPQKELVFFLR